MRNDGFKRFSMIPFELIFEQGKVGFLRKGEHERAFLQVFVIVFFDIADFRVKAYLKIVDSLV